MRVAGVHGFTPNFDHPRRASNSKQTVAFLCQGVFKNGSRRREEADFGSKINSASLPRRLRLLRRILNSPWVHCGPTIPPYALHFFRPAPGQGIHSTRHRANGIKPLRVGPLTTAPSLFARQPFAAACRTLQAPASPSTASSARTSRVRAGTDRFQACVPVGTTGCLMATRGSSTVLALPSGYR